MADSIPEPWICPYLINAAETHGGSLQGIPIWSTKKKRAQIIEFLTYRDDDHIWAVISDKAHKLPVRFSKEAVAKYASLNDARLTQCKNGLVLIREFRPMFTRIPVGRGISELTTNAHLALEVGFVQYVGGSGHIIGDPQNLEKNNLLKMWVEGLRQNGGGGQLRKQQEQLLAQPNLVDNIGEALRSPVHLNSDAQARSNDPPQPAPDKTKSSGITPPKSDPMREWTKTWRSFQTDPWAYIKQAPKNEPHLANDEINTAVSLERPDHSDASLPKTPDRKDLDSEQVLTQQLPRTPSKSPKTRPSASPAVEPTTPRTSEWSPSIRGSPRPSSPLNIDAEPVGNRSGTPEIEECVQDNHPPFFSSAPSQPSMRPPTPAPRIRSVPPVELPTAGIPTSSPPPPSSSLPIPPKSSIQLPLRKSMKRKVPHPGDPPPRPILNASDPVQILVPNSDTSGMASQPSQSQSQSQPHPLSVSQPLAGPEESISTDNARLPRPMNTTPIGIEPALSQPDGQYNADISSTALSQEHLPQLGIIQAHSRPTTSESNALVSSALVTHHINGSDSVKVHSRSNENNSTGKNLPHNDRIELSEDDADTNDRLHGSASRSPDPIQHRLVEGSDDDSTKALFTPERASSPFGSLFSASPSAEISISQSREASPQIAQLVDSVPIASSSRMTARKASPQNAQLVDSVPNALSSRTTARETSPQSAQLVDSVPIASSSRMTARKESVQDAHVPADSHCNHEVIHNANAWREPSFMSSQKGKSKPVAEEVLVEDPPKTQQKRRRSPLSSPLRAAPLKKKLKVSEQQGSSLSRSGPAPSNTTEGNLTHSKRARFPRNDSMGLGVDITASQNVSESSIPMSSMPSGRQKRAKVARFFVDLDTEPGNLSMSWKEIKKVQLRTGRIRTLGDIAEADGSIYVDSD
ncbi:hypothetical protein BJ138DRAFT_1113950 [Hygrophoropsis aurantiaca]|uniref:Uncharacterized protein n=1 Tax=Hygrophoropsis aurantiaca TaxID=72124 RepID=A0ACB8AD27_9AGAM|nr:hypothetical protein BJ138DRAFT_1113950 [Hygrophoropsis aurantiaca]